MYLRKLAYSEQRVDGTIENLKDLQIGLDVTVNVLEYVCDLILSYKLFLISVQHCSNIV